MRKGGTTERLCLSSIRHTAEPRPRLIINMARLSKGEMIGVKYNKDLDWVGGSVGFFEK
jgi:hypothetical protein